MLFDPEYNKHGFLTFEKPAELWTFFYGNATQRKLNAIAAVFEHPASGPEVEHWFLFKSGVSGIVDSNGDNPLQGWPAGLAPIYNASTYGGKRYYVDTSTQGTGGQAGGLGLVFDPSNAGDSLFDTGLTQVKSKLGLMSTITNSMVQYVRGINVRSTLPVSQASDASITGFLYEAQWGLSWDTRALVFMEDEVAVSGNPYNPDGKVVIHQSTESGAQVPHPSKWSRYKRRISGASNLKVFLDLSASLFGAGVPYARSEVYRWASKPATMPRVPGEPGYP